MTKNFTSLKNFVQANFRFLINDFILKQNFENRILKISFVIFGCFLNHVFVRRVSNFYSASICDYKNSIKKHAKIILKIPSFYKITMFFAILLKGSDDKNQLEMANRRHLLNTRRIFDEFCDQLQIKIQSVVKEWKSILILMSVDRINANLDLGFERHF